MPTRKPPAKKAEKRPNKTYAALIKIMKASGMNGMDYHRKTGIHQSTISQALNGHRCRPSAEFFASIAKASGITAEEFGKLMYKCV